MGQVTGKWIKKDSQSLTTNLNQELQVLVNPTGSIIRTASGIDIAANGITDAQLAGGIDDSKLATSYIKADGSRTFTGNQSMGGHRLTSVAQPLADTDAANKIYVDTVAQGLIVKASVRAGTTMELVSTYNAGAKTLTADNNGSLVVDSVALAVDDRVLVKDQADAAENGIYVVTATGDTTHPWILTRAIDFDGSSATEVTSGAFTFITEGNVNHDGGWTLITDGTITIGTTPLEFQQFSGAGQITVGGGLTKVGNIISVGASVGSGITVGTNSIAIALDGTTLELTATGLKVNAAGITATELNAAICGNGLTGGSGTALSVLLGNGLVFAGKDITIKLADGTLTNGVDGLQVSAGGITSSQLASNSVTSVKIDASVAGNGLIGGAGSALSVGAGTGITVTADAVAVKTSDIVDTTKGLAVTSNLVSINLDAASGLTFNSGALRLANTVAGAGLSTVANSGVLTVAVGSGIQISGGAVTLGPLGSNWNTYNGSTHYTITGLADPVNATDAANKQWVQSAITAANANADRVEQFTLNATNISNKYITLSATPTTPGNVVIIIANAPGQYYGIDFQMSGTTPTQLTWGGMGLDGLLASGDMITVMYNAAV